MAQNNTQKRERAAKAARKKQLETITSKTLQSLKAQTVDPSMKKKSDLPINPEVQKKKQKLGKHAVPSERLDVQLGEELSENLRGLKVRDKVLHSIPCKNSYPL